MQSAHAFQQMHESAIKAEMDAFKMKTATKAVRKILPITVIKRPEKFFTPKIS